MIPDTDRYYTPPTLATSIVTLLASTQVTACIDTACGCGNLLAAVQQRYPKSKCFGMDIDESAIRRVQRNNPEWVLSVADVLNPASFRKTRVFGELTAADVAVLNPPFSLGEQKGVLVYDANGNTKRCGRAMAHLIQVMRALPPRFEFVAIVPESLMHSEMDAWGREWLSNHWDVRTVEGVRNSTFSGARVNCLVVHGLARKPSRRKPDGARLALKNCTLIRGGLPVHASVTSKKNGVPYVHSTDLKNVALGNFENLRRVANTGRALVDGHVILLPRVGLPILGNIEARNIDKEVQLSDCVIALKFQSAKESSNAANKIRHEFKSLCGLYRGTGARYVTVARLVQWTEARVLGGA
jgi:hypothetical protein